MGVPLCVIQPLWLTHTLWFPPLPSIAKFAEKSAPYQYPDGPLIAVQGENEYFSSENPRSSNRPGLNQHMQDILDVYHQHGLNKIPTIHNDKNAAGIFAGVGGDNNDPSGGKGTNKSREGKVDLYGWDGYPLGFDCDRPERWNELSTRMCSFAALVYGRLRLVFGFGDTEHDASHQKLNPAEPLALFEWQGMVSSRINACSLTFLVCLRRCFLLLVWPWIRYVL